MSPERRQFDIEAIKGSIDLVEFAGRFTQLTRISRRGEYAGPCPACGGEDRFHVVAATGRFYCRQCRPRGGDVIDLVQMIQDVTFVEACRLLSGDAWPAPKLRRSAPPAQQGRERKAPGWQEAAFQESARRTMWATQRRLLGAQGHAGQDYLRRRGLGADTWRAYGLGFGTAYHPARREQRDAIFIPWFAREGEVITAIQHRFIDPDLGKGERYSQKPGSAPLLFGLPALEHRPEEAAGGPRTLCIVEGEVNCMSLYEIGEAALSVGSETNVGNEQVLSALADRARAHERVVVWFDDPAYAGRLIDTLGRMGPFRETEVQPVTSLFDANDLLAAGELAAFVATLCDDTR